MRESTGLVKILARVKVEKGQIGIVRESVKMWRVPFVGFYQRVS